MITQKKREGAGVVVPFVRGQGEAGQCSHASVVHRRKCQPTDCEVDYWGTVWPSNLKVVPVGGVEDFGPVPDPPRPHPDPDDWKGGQTCVLAGEAEFEISFTK